MIIREAFNQIDRYQRDSFWAGCGLFEYQIVATERILQRIATATNHRQLGTMAAGGYIWHTTGSSKTLTSFKAAQLARGQTLLHGVRQPAERHSARAAAKSRSDLQFCRQ